MIKSILILIFFFIYNLSHSQYFPFKKENKFDTIAYKRIRDSLIAHPEKNTLQTVKEESIFYNSKDGTSIIMSYNKKGEGFLQITKGSHWTIYSYFKNLQLSYKQENLGRYNPTGIWKEYNTEGKLLKEEDMDVQYDDRPEFIDKKIKLVSIRNIAAKLNTNYQKNIFSDNNFWDIKTSIDTKTNKWVYTISFYDDQKENTLNCFYYDAHNGNFLKKESIPLTKEIDFQ
ncbi:hypothetical protein [Chryseobacterium sp. BIGb0232]|uniref:hypothetical protein n=1 Tax=Chryseobacterium sp. BIGb0232 TaxID=2940598 RepID=UPI000F484E1D|nr:hypothetical protein [Chryseobacterium sp. BIGb0232]MCS4303331.1 hypothetical protein [Chryseobacterium sp. BIGb0232]ROS11397.1 hypothetical protein EDF65_3805 [Chryseobacterium nakagawai]